MNRVIGGVMHEKTSSASAISNRLSRNLLDWISTATQFPPHPRHCRLDRDRLSKKGAAAEIIRRTLSSVRKRSAASGGVANRAIRSLGRLAMARAPRGSAVASSARREAARAQSHEDVGRGHALSAGPKTRACSATAVPHLSCQVIS